MSKAKLQILVCLMTMLFAASNTSAAPARTTWTGFLYQGPGNHYAVIDEVPEFSQVDMAGCDKSWCRVTFNGKIGYVKSELVVAGDLANPGRDKLAQPAAALSDQPPKGPCFEANQTGGNGGNAMTVFCQK